MLWIACRTNERVHALCIVMLWSLVGWGGMTMLNDYVAVRCSYYLIPYSKCIDLFDDHLLSLHPTRRYRKSI